MKLGIIGLGHVSKYQIQAIRQIEDIHLVATWDTNINKSDLSPTTFYTALDEMLESDVEAVVVAVPNPYHYGVAKQVLEAGKHALVEKPATKTVEEFEDLCRIADDHEVSMHTAFHAAFAPDVLWLRENIGGAGFGNITGFHVGFYDPYVVDGNLLPQGTTLEGSWTDSCINALSVLAHFIPDLQVEEALLGESHPYDCQEVTGLVHFKFGDNYSGTVDTNWLLGLNRKMTRIDYKGVDGYNDSAFILDHSNQRVLAPNGFVLADLGEGRERLTNHYIGVLEDFVKHVELGEDNREYSRICHELHRL